MTRGEKMSDEQRQVETQSLLCTTIETAELLGIGRMHVYRLMNGGQLQSVKIGARRLIPRSVVED